MEKTREWEKANERSSSSRLSETVFSLFDNLISFNTFSGVALVVAITLETVIYINTFLLLVDSAFGKTVHDMYFWLNYLDPTYSLALAKSAAYVIVSVLSFGFFFLLLIAVLFVSNWCRTETVAATDRSSSLARSYLLRIGGMLVVTMRIVLLQPTVTILMLTSRCEKCYFGVEVEELGYDCPGTMRTVLLMLSVVMLGLTIFVVAVSIVFFADEDPRSRLPWACGSQAVEAYKLVRKVAVSLGLHFAVDNSAVGTVAIAFCLILSMLIVLALYRQLYMQDRRVLYFTTTSEAVIVWLTLLVAIQTITGLECLNPVGLCVFAVVSFICAVLIHRARCDSILHCHDLNALKDPGDVEVYARILVGRLWESKSGTDPSVDGFIQLHSLECKDPECPCRRPESCDCAEEEAKLQVPETGTPLDEKRPPKIVTVESSSAASQAKMIVMKIVVSSLVRWKERHGSTARLDLYVGHLKCATWENSLAALYEVMCSQKEQQPSIYETFGGYRLTMKIEGQIAAQDSRENAPSEIDSMIVFQRLLADMQEGMNEVLKKFFGFWKELQDESPNFEYIGTISNEIAQRVGEIRTDYHLLISASPSNMYCRMLYAIFLRNVVKDEFEASDVHGETVRTSSNMRIQNAHGHDEMLDLNNRTGLFIISGEMTTVGIVLGINNEVLELLGHEKHEVLGQNISCVMPPIVGERHSEFVMNSLQCQQPNENSGRLALALHRQGYIVPCTYMHREMPSLRHGLQFIGFLRKIVDFSQYSPVTERNVGPDELVLLLTDQNWAIQSFNLKAAKLLGVSPTKSNSLRKYALGERSGKILATALIPELGDDPVRTPTSAQIDVRAARQVIDAEIETIHLDSEADPVPAAEGDESGVAAECETAVMRGPMTVTELVYGHKNKLRMKLVAIYLEQLREQAEVGEGSSADFLLQGKKRKDSGDLANDLASQSSNSSVSLAEQGQRSVRRFKDILRVQSSPFFIRCFVKLGIAVFLLILTAAIVEFVIVYNVIPTIDSALNNGFILFRRTYLAHSIANSFRSVYDIYQGTEANSSEILPDRLAFYVKLISDETELMRGYSHEFESEGIPFNEEHTAIFRSPLVQFSETPDLSSQTNSVSVVNYTLSAAIAQYVAKATQLQQFDLASIRAGQSVANSSFNNSVVRLLDFMITNMKGTFSTYISSSMIWHNQEFDISLSNTYKSIVAVFIADPIVLFLLVLMFIPYILRVQANLLWVCMNLCKFKQGEVQTWLEACTSAANDLRATTSAMRGIYCKVSFDITVTVDPEIDSETGKPDSTPPAAVLHGDATKAPLEGDQTGAFAAGDMSTTNKQTEDKFIPAKIGPTDEEKTRLLEINSMRENEVNSRRQKVLSQLTKRRTRVYLFYLAIFGVYIAGFRAADLVVFTQLYYENLECEDTYKILAAREINDLKSEFYFREELIAGHPISGSAPDLVGFYLGVALKAELDYAQHRATLVSGLLANFATFLHKIDLDQFCENLFVDAGWIANCRKAYGGIAVTGLNSIIMNALSHIKRVHSRLLLEYKVMNSGYAMAALRDVETVKMNDAWNVWVNNGDMISFGQFAAILTDWLKHYSVILKLKFALYIVFIFILFGLIWAKMASDMRTDIASTVGILGVLPTTYLASNPGFIKDLNASSLVG